MEKSQDFRAEMEAAAEEASACLRALSNPSRLMILCLLVEGEKSVGEIERALDLSQAYVSQQLARLRAEGIVEAERDGRTMRYHICDDRILPVIETLYAQFCETAKRTPDQNGTELNLVP